MYYLLQFLRSISLLLLFLVLEGAAILFYAHSNSYTHAKILGYTATVSGVVGEVTGGVSRYFALRTENDMLIGRVMELERELHSIKRAHSDSVLMAHTLVDETGMKYLMAHVVRNSTNRSKNYIVIDRGLSSGVRSRMAVATPTGEIVGSVVSCNENYSVVMSLLNSEFFTSGRLEVSDHVGGISWDGRDRHTIQLTDLSKYAEPFEGAEIVTTGLSRTFPRGLKIGRVIDYERSLVDGSYRVNVEVAADMTALYNVVVINSTAIGEASAVMESFERDGRIEMGGEAEVVEEVEIPENETNSEPVEVDFDKSLLYSPSEIEEYEKIEEVEAEEGSDNNM